MINPILWSMCSWVPMNWKIIILSCAIWYPSSTSESDQKSMVMIWTNEETSIWRGNNDHFHGFDVLLWSTLGSWYMQVVAGSICKHPASINCWSAHLYCMYFWKPLLLFSIWRNNGLFARFQVRTNSNSHYTQDQHY